ncbi:MAG: transglutaminase-like domain-containing protein [Herbinix sp.]|nr:transglutaminase-like domain-containing protein [Herbinix sp.]
MGKELQDGIMMDHSFFIIDEKKPGFPISARLIQILAIIIGSWSFISVLLESIALPVNGLFVYAAIFILTGILFILCLFPSYDLVKLFFAVLFYGLFLYSRLPRLSNAFYIIENLVLDRLASYYNYVSIHYQADYSSEIADTTLLVIMILIPMMTLLSVAIIRNRLVGLCSILLFLPITLCFIFGLIPSEQYLIAYVAAVLYLSRSGFSIRNIDNKAQLTLLQRINSRAAVWLSIFGILIFFFLKLFVTEDKYENISEIKDVKIKIQTAMLDFTYEDFTKQAEDFNLFENAVATGGLSGGKLSNSGEVTYTDSEQLLIMVPYESAAEGIYLKGYVGSVYTGDRWEEHSKEDKKKYKELQKNLSKEVFAPTNQTFQLINQILNLNRTGDDLNTNFLPDYEIYQGNCEIEYKEANKKYIYTPYFTNYELLGQTYSKQDLYTAPKKRKDKYEFNYFFNLSSNYLLYILSKEGQIDSYKQYEKLYRDYVYQVYTEMPEDGLERLKKDFSEDNIQVTGVTEKIAYVKNYLDQNTEYSLSPGKLPSDKDFVEYFLYENKLGYCSHYASAATLMLRAMGIPARYVEGYAVGPGQVSQSQTEEIQTVTAYIGSDIGKYNYDMNMIQIIVRDYNAHAWVEVYIDGCGWIPIEFTPGSAIEYNNSVVNNLTQAKDIISQEEAAAPTKEPAQPTSAVTDQKTDKQANKSNHLATITGNTKENIRLNHIFIIVFLLLSISVGTVFLIIKIRKRRRIRSSQNRNKTALFLFMEIEKILLFCQVLPGKGSRLEDCEAQVREQSSYIDCVMFDTCMDIVKKARFGKENVTLQELKEVAQLRQNLYTEYYKKLPFFKKLFLKLILLM